MGKLEATNTNIYPQFSITLKHVFTLVFNLKDLNLLKIL